MGIDPTTQGYARHRNTQSERGALYEVARRCASEQRVLV
jgi:hypothetical protein